MNENKRKTEYTASERQLVDAAERRERERSLSKKGYTQSGDKLEHVSLRHYGRQPKKELPEPTHTRDYPLTEGQINELVIGDAIRKFPLKCAIKWISRENPFWLDREGRDMESQFADEFECKLRVEEILLSTQSIVVQGTILDTQHLSADAWRRKNGASNDKKPGEPDFAFEMPISSLYDDSPLGKAINNAMDKARQILLGLLKNKAK